MNQNNIHDALNLLDDDMIEAVEKLRNGKNKSKKIWVRWITLAACFCIVWVGVFMASRNELLLPGGIYRGNELKGSSEKVPETGENLSGKSPSVLVEITSWQKDSFSGTVSGIADTTKYPVGTEVVIQFAENICVEILTNTGYKNEIGAPDASDFPIGSVVRVQFTERETGNMEGKTILYAEIIAHPK